MSKISYQQRQQTSHASSVPSSSPPLWKRNGVAKWCLAVLVYGLLEPPALALPPSPLLHRFSAPPSLSSLRTTKELLKPGGPGFDWFPTPFIAEHLLQSPYSLYGITNMLFGFSGPVLLILTSTRVFVAGWRHALRSEWPFIIIITRVDLTAGSCFCCCTSSSRPFPFRPQSPGQCWCTS